MNYVLRIVSVQAGGCHRHSTHLPCLGWQRKQKPKKRPLDAYLALAPLPSFSGKTGQKEAGFPCSQ